MLIDLAPQRIVKYSLQLEFAKYPMDLDDGYLALKVSEITAAKS